MQSPKHEDDLIKPAVKGTVNVIKAAQETGTVKKIVLTSSTEVIGHCGPATGEKPLTEENWSDVKHHTMYPYAKSKTLAERAAWDFIAEITDEKKIELAVINPSMEFGGPILYTGNNSSMAFPIMLLNKEMPMLPNNGFGVCDVRDIAKAHVKAMKLPEAAGHRHIVDSGFMWFKDMADVIEKEFKPQGYNIPKTLAWNFLIKITALFDATAKTLVPVLGLRQIFDNSRLKNVLGITPYPVEQSVLEVCYSLIETGRVKKTNNYRGRPE